MATRILTQQRLQELLKYDSLTGVFTWSVTRGNMRAGACAGTYDKRGYLRISIDSVVYAAHRLAWLYVHSAWPSGVIDHINRNTGDNRLCNLRDTDQCVNTQNACTRKDSPVGLRGVTRHPYSKKWRARIQANGKSVELGSFDTIDAAAAAYAAAAAVMHCKSLAPLGRTLVR
jgi:hypothetical protein